MTGDPRKAAIYTRTDESRVSVDRQVGILTALAEYEQETYHARADRGMEYATRKLSEARGLIEADSEAAVSLMMDASKALDEAIRWARGEAADEDRQDDDARR